MGKSIKWSFIANHTDTSLMRKSIIYTVAGEILEYTPKFTLVYIYINNEYMGLYILTKRVEVDDRYPDEISGFVTDGGQPMIFKNPEYATGSEIMYISGFFDKIKMSLGTSINNAFEWFIVTFNLENLF